MLCAGFGWVRAGGEPPSRGRSRGEGEERETVVPAVERGSSGFEAQPGKGQRPQHIRQPNAAERQEQQKPALETPEAKPFPEKKRDHQEPLQRADAAAAVRHLDPFAERFHPVSPDVDRPAKEVENLRRHLNHAV
jgi:hypothetical protein